ncbi:Ubiquitin-like domain-containing protein [Mycena chlorophos]|uniref:Ubiquitin-like domain-containing protein n=1 Tax=Mycena chlorophos TaxID=658473 RepID=A0A8H6W536_MYCCL|nr:Ubiquitin-like domain-containing protein [Mycena chlorophos]
MADEQGGSQEEVKAEETNGTINIKVVSSTGEEIFFKIKKNTNLRKLRGAYASKVGKDVGTIRFLYDGERINEDDTPNSLEMEDDGASPPPQKRVASALTPPNALDTIDVMVEQIGGVLP